MPPRTGLLGIIFLFSFLPFSLLFIPSHSIIQKMMQLNIPLNEDGTIDFYSTLLSIVCRALSIETQGINTEERI